MKTLFGEETKAPPLVLRPYQKECVEKIMWDLNNEGNSLCVVPTGGGKSIIIAESVRALNQHVLILQPSKEILEQNYEKLLRYVDDKDIGIYSASMNEKEVGRFTFATIQSIYKTPEKFAHFKLVFVDEAHLVNPKDLSGMYSKFLKEIGNPKVIGFSATPYRMDTMYLNYGQENATVVTTIKLINRMKGFFWGRILYNLSMQELIDMGFLCAPVYLDASVVEQYEIPLNVSRSEFNMDVFEKIMESRNEKIMRAIDYSLKNSKSVLVFCSSVAQATSLHEKVQGSAVVSAKTPAKERDRIINNFKSHDIKIVFNVGVLTTGFDHPSLDCIILMRPTRSIMLYVQMVGRGVRIAEGKTACKVIDLTSTVKNMGRVETIRLHKEPGEKWELISETGSWHGKELYRFDINKTVQVKEINYDIEP